MFYAYQETRDNTVFIHKVLRGKKRKWSSSKKENFLQSCSHAAVTSAQCQLIPGLRADLIPCHYIFHFPIYSINSGPGIFTSPYFWGGHHMKQLHLLINPTVRSPSGLTPKVTAGRSPDSRQPSLQLEFYSKPPRTWIKYVQVQLQPIKSVFMHVSPYLSYIC